MPLIDFIYNDFNWFGILCLVSFVICYLFAHHIVKKTAILGTKEQINDLLFYCLIAIVISGRFAYVLLYQFEYFLIEPLFILKFWLGGNSLFGGIIGIIAVVFIFTHQENFKSFSDRETYALKLMDFLSVLAPVVIAACSIGDYINGDIHGRVTELPWSVIYSQDTAASPRHPVQLYQFLLEGLLLFILLLFVNNKVNQLGFATGLFLIFYSVFHLLLGFYQELELFRQVYFSVLSKEQLLSFPLLIVGCIIVFWGHIKQANTFIIEGK